MNNSVIESKSEPHLSWLQSDLEKCLLIEHFQNKNMKMLGTYFEALWDFYLSYSPKTKLITKNLQVIQDKRTLGEFDFIYENLEPRNFVHLEVAVKYYLGVPEIDHCRNVDYSSLDCWIGPNINDRLDIKLDKLINFQSRLSESNRGKELLSQFSINEITPEICLLGYLFYPLNESMKPPTDSNKKHNRGYWTPLANLNSLVSKEEYWQVIEKPFWLSPLEVESETKLGRALTVARVEQIVEKFNRPVLIGSFIPNQKSFLRKDLYFIVPDTWRKSVVDKMG